MEPDSTISRLPGGALRPLPVYHQVANAIEHEIEEGRLRPGQKIQSLREICIRFDISNVTAKRAIHKLRERGVIRTRAGSGAFVSDGRPSRISAVKRNQVGLLMFGAQIRPVYQYELECVAIAMRRQGHPMIFNVARDLEDLGHSVDHQRDAGVNCLIFMPRHGSWAEDGRAIEHLHRTQLPLLILESTHDQDAYIVADIAGGIELAVDHLHRLGHRRICLITAFGRKIAAFERAAASRTGSGIQPTLIANSDDSQQAMADIASQVLRMSPRPTAIIANNDRLAEALIVHCLSAGVRVPQDISIIGFDDTPEGAILPPVPLTTIRHPVWAMANEAARWAGVRLAGNNGAGRKLRKRIPCTLIQRSSTGAAP